MKRVEETMKKWIYVGVVVATGLTAWAAGDEIQRLGEQAFRDSLQQLQREPRGRERLRLARSTLSAYWLSSQQVKAIAARLEDDDARLEFARMAYPRTVDPENFYEVYDAFTHFSRVMRLHDDLQDLRRPRGRPVLLLPQPVTDAELAEMIRAIQQEGLDSGRQRVAKQILGSSQGNFLARQIRQIVDCMNFEASKMEIAKFAYDYTLDQEKYFLVSEAFAFGTTKENLARYIESRRQGSKPPGQ